VLHFGKHTKIPREMDNSTNGPTSGHQLAGAFSKTLNGETFVFSNTTSILKTCGSLHQPNLPFDSHNHTYNDFGLPSTMVRVCSPITKQNSNPPNTESPTTLLDQPKPSLQPSQFSVLLSKNLLAGAMARCGAAIIMFPIDVVKTRLQFQRQDAFRQGKLRHHYKHGVDAFFTILKEEGFRGLYKGLSIRLIYITPAAAVSFTVYEQFMRSIQGVSFFGSGKTNPSDFSWTTPILTLSAGVSARILGTACRTPFDILKQQLQVEGQLKLNKLELKSRSGIIGTLKTIVKQDGISGFFSGYAVTLMRDAPFAAIYFTSYETIKRLLNVPPKGEGQQKSAKSVHHLLAGALAGAIGTTCTIPIDVVKTRLQTQSKTGKKEYDGIKDAFRKIYKEEGWKGFTRGLGPRLTYIMPASALTFTLYEKLKLILNIDEKQHSSSSAEQH